jgi:microcystin-dependent protein
MGRETGQPYEESRVIPYIGEVRMFGFDFVPFCWAPCDGRLLPINDNQVLFSLLGTTFGGDGKTNFALPDLRGMVAPFKPLTFCIAMGGAFPPRGKPDPGSGANPYIGEVRMLGCNFAPGGWAACDGLLLPFKLGWKMEYDPYQALFSLVGRPLAATARPISRCPTCAAWWHHLSR